MATTAPSGRITTIEAGVPSLTEIARFRGVDLGEPFLGNGEENGLFALSSFLAYTHFDPRPFPNLNARLEAQGIERPPAAQIPFFCKRD